MMCIFKSMDQSASTLYCLADCLTKQLRWLVNWGHVILLKTIENSNVIQFLFKSLKCFLHLVIKKKLFFEDFFQPLFFIWFSWKSRKIFMVLIFYPNSADIYKICRFLFLLYFLLLEITHVSCQKDLKSKYFPGTSSIK